MCLDEMCCLLVECVDAIERESSPLFFADDGKKAIERDCTNSGGFAQTRMHPHIDIIAQVIIIRVQSYIKWGFANAQHERRRHYYTIDLAKRCSFLDPWWKKDDVMYSHTARILFTRKFRKKRTAQINFVSKRKTFFSLSNDGRFSNGFDGGVLCDVYYSLAEAFFRPSDRITWLPPFSFFHVWPLR